MRCTVPPRTVLGHVLADAGPVVVPVVADRLVRGHVLHERRRHLERAVEVAQREQRVRVLRQLVERRGRRRSVRSVERRRLRRAPARRCRSASATDGQRALDLLGHRLELHARARPSRAGTGAAPGSSRMPCLERVGRALDRVAQALLVAAERLEGGGHVHEQLGVGVAPPARSGRRCGAARRKKLRSSVSSVGQRAHHRLERGHERHEVLDRRVDRRAAAGERVAVALEHRALVRGACPSSQVEKNSSSSTGLRRLVERRASRPARSVWLELPGCSSMYLRPSAERGRIGELGVARQLAVLLLELHVDHRDGAAVAPPRSRSARSGRPRRPGSRRSAPRCPTTRLEPPGISAFTS